MTGSNRKALANALLERILTELDPVYIAQNIGYPLDQAAAVFILPEAPVEIPITPGMFLEITGAFVQHLGGCGRRPPHTLPMDRAQAEAIRLLELGCRYPGEAGYDSVMLDALMNGREGLKRALGAITLALKQELQQQHMDFLLRHLPGLHPWEVRAELAAQLIRKAPWCFAGEIQAAPERFTLCLDELLLQYAEAEAETRYRLGLR